MTPHNQTICTALNRALDALFDLEAAGCTITEIRIEGGKPHIAVDRRPPNVQSVVRTSGSFYTPKTHCFGELSGCRVDWNEAHSIAQLEEHS